VFTILSLKVWGPKVLFGLASKRNLKAMFWVLFRFVQIELHKERLSPSCIYLNVTAKHLLHVHFEPLCFTVKPRYNDPRYNDIPSINMLCPGKSCSKMYGTEPRYNNLRYNDIADITMSFWRTERKIFPDITMLQYQHTVQFNNNTTVIDYSNLWRFCEQFQFTVPVYQ